MALNILESFRAAGRNFFGSAPASLHEFKERVARTIPRSDNSSTFHGSFALKEAGLLGREVTDIDILSTSYDAAWENMERDVARLVKKGYTVTPHKKNPDDPESTPILSATVSKGAHSAEIDWSCVRAHFFVPWYDKKYGFVANPRDVAAGKLELILKHAFADNKHFLDLLHMHARGLPLNGAVAEAAFERVGLGDAVEMMDVLREHRQLAVAGTNLRGFDDMKPKLYDALDPVLHTPVKPAHSAAASKAQLAYKLA